MTTPSSFCSRIIIAALVCFAATLPATSYGAETTGSQWVSIFNGKDLTGWTPKIKGYDLGDNFGETFRVEDGLLKVRYDKYESFDGKFGHMFYKDKLSKYRLRVEYRFVGEQTTGGLPWALRNSGVMLHCQDPATMTKGQNFPVSLEAQFLGGDGTKERSTANLCTPGTTVKIDGKPQEGHCTNSTSRTYHGDEWVTVELEVNSSGTIRHIIDGKPVLTYSEPELDPKDREAKPLIVNGDAVIKGGYIALQSESHPIDFRKVELMILETSE
jgi:hypothetical protein